MVRIPLLTPVNLPFSGRVFNEIPPKFHEVWPVEQVLAYLKQLKLLHALKVKELS